MIFFPGLKEILRLAGMLIVSPVFGFFPILSGRSFTDIVKYPTILTVPPAESEFAIVSKVSPTTVETTSFGMEVLSET